MGREILGRMNAKQRGIDDPADDCTVSNAASLDGTGLDEKVEIRTARVPETMDALR